MSNHPKLDDFIKETLTKDMETIEVPEFEQVWQGVVNRRQKAKEKRRNKLLVQVAAIFMVMISGIAFTMPSFVSAVSSKIERIILERKDGGIELRTKVEREDKQHLSSLPPPPPENIQELEPEEYKLDLADAQSMTPFHIKSPQYLPEGFASEKVEIIKFHNSFHVIQRYVNGEQYFMLEQENILGERASSRNFSQDAKIQEVQVQGSVATLVDFSAVSNMFMIFWTTPDMDWEIRTNTSVEELLKLTKSLK